MKIAFSLIYILAISFGNIKAQVTRVYAFSQNVFGGAEIAKSVDTNSGKKAPNEESIYYLYAIVNQISNVRFKQIWIRKELFDCKTEIIKIFPVLIGSVEPGIFKNDTLIRSSSLPVVQFRVEKDKTPMGKVPFLAIQNELVLYYSFRNKPYSFSIKKIQQLNPLYTPAPAMRQRGQDMKIKR